MAVKGHVLEHYPCAVLCFHEVPGALGHFKFLPLTMFNLVELHYIHLYIHTHTHTHIHSYIHTHTLTHAHLTSHHCTHEASALILLVTYYMATHTQTHSKTHVYTLTHLDQSHHQHCCDRGRPHTVDLPPHQRGRVLEGWGQRRRGR